MSSLFKNEFVTNACDIFSLSRLVSFFSRERSFEEGSNEDRLLDFTGKILDDLLTGSNLIIEDDIKEIARKMMDPSINAAFKSFLQAARTVNAGKQVTVDVARDISRKVRTFRNLVDEANHDKMVSPGKFTGLVRFLEDLAMDKIKANNLIAFNGILT
jgi:hypothetical protein